MRQIWNILLFACCLIGTASGQNTMEIAGRVLEASTGDPIPYAHVYNRSTQKGTISNTDGYFRMLINNANDTLQVSYIGYKDQVFQAGEFPDFLIINLEENSQLLGEVTIYPSDNSYLYQLLHSCKKAAPATSVKSKAYFELKSFVDDAQIELVEGYYNTSIQGYQLNQLDLKAGRIALQPYSNRFFASLESSRTLVMLNLFSRNDFFPINPLALNKFALKNKYYLNLQTSYMNENSDSVYVIVYQPKDTTGQGFEGKIWVNKTKEQILKITLNCDVTQKHPFIPIFSSDKINHVSFNITQSFQTTEGTSVFNHIDFIYKINYTSRVGEVDEKNYVIQTNAILYAYDYHNTFFLPLYQLHDLQIGDYRKINAMPYNDFFWTYNDEYGLDDSSNSNELFFTNEKSISNQELFKANTFTKKGLFEHPYISWSPARIRFREIISDTSLNSSTIGYPPEPYKLDVKIFADFNSYSDSTHILTAAIIDPFTSFFNLPMDNQSHCFVNMYFDLCEIYRRELDRKLKSAPNTPETMEKIYNDFLPQFDAATKAYLLDVDHGTNQIQMIRYNEVVHQQLGIDNIALFQPFQSEQ